MCFNQKGDISIINDSFLKLVDKFTYLRSCISSTEKDINIRQVKTWTAINTLSITWKSNLSDKIKRMLQTVLNKSWKQHLTKQQLYGQLLPISKIIYVRRTRHTGHCWRNKDKHISDILLWTLLHGCTSVGRLRRTYLQQLCMDTGRRLEYLLEVMDDKDTWQVRARKICASFTIWWWSIYIYIYIYIYI